MGQLTNSPNIERVDFKLHPKQGRAYRCQKRVVCCCSGIQGGKSLVGAFRLLWETTIHYPPNKFPEAAFVVCSPDYKSMVQSTRPVFDSIFNGYGKMNEMEKVFYLNDGRKIFFRTMVKNPQAVEGIQNVVFIWADEAGQYPRSSWINMESRTAFRRGTLFLTTTPYGMNWIKREVIKRADSGDPDVGYFEWTSADNPAFPQDEYERQKRILSPREFRRKYMGIHEAMEGLIHDGWDQDNLMDPFQLPPNARYLGGVDWGFDHPLAIVIYAIVDGTVYVVSLFKKSGLSASQQIELIKSKRTMFHVELFSCGHDRPDMIADLQASGVPAVKYFEFYPNMREVRAGDQRLSELIRTKRFRMFRSVDQLEDWEDEISTYAWDKNENDPEGKEKPVDTNNDLMSAARYAAIISGPYLTKKVELPAAPMETTAQRDVFNPRLRSKKKSHWSAY